MQEELSSKAAFTAFSLLIALLVQKTHTQNANERMKGKIELFFHSIQFKMRPGMGGRGRREFQCTCVCRIRV